jgi:hypothetical protein
VIGKWVLENLPAADDPVVTAYKARPGAYLETRDDKNAAARIAMARGLLATIDAEATAVYGKQTPIVAVTMASALSGIAFAREDLRRIRLNAKRSNAG